MELVALLPVLLVVLVLLLLYKYGTRNYGTLEKLGIPVIKPYPFVGSVPRPWRLYLREEDLRHAKQFNGVWGLYEGPTPQVFIADREMVKRIFIKDFSNFSERFVANFYSSATKDLLDMLVHDRWKVVRAILTPALSTGAKLKAMMPTLEHCARDACTRLDQELLKSPVVQIKDALFGPLVLDAVAQFTFGLKVPNISDSTHPFVKAAKTFGGDEFSSPVISGLLTFSPKLSSMLMSKFMAPPLQLLTDILRKSVKERRATGADRADLVGALIDAIDNKVPTKEFRELDITEDVLLLQGANLLMDAYDTTGNTLSLCAYHLATNPDVMARVLEEISGVELTYEALQQLPLLEAVMQEALRVSPFIPRHQRTCQRDWQCGNLRLPAGTCVTIPVWPLHLDPEVFPEPERFLPDRWLGEEGRQLGQYNWMPFGLGPRACIGMRLATMEVKFVLAYVLQRYRLIAAPETKLVYRKGTSVFSGFYPIHIKVEKL
ncbi:cytochrome P450 3A29-like [Pollicipes pollicipes]|uniref:cytochrome P450 3A29-like n=1 Tax=Pollicipes pollicipes TaxID=41117 RepID=UPI0018849E43|nr:cytochrome P450 3A29-like isoform X1 [Pollicipes pollicipes]XP_037075071.1 cytochrome P450 3A29-like isoform X2 [Pollicipes pollicipes]XP_037076081.1 cytochrome P450 3A29-like [Pollicipes pollicipes]